VLAVVSLGAGLALAGVDVVSVVPLEVWPERGLGRPIVMQSSRWFAVCAAKHPSLILSESEIGTRLRSCPN